MAPDEICVRLGEARFKEMFSCLTAAQMKQMLGEARISTARLPSHTSTRKRNEDWAVKLWRALPTGKDPVGTTLLYQWLSHKRNPMMALFLDTLGVPHKNGLTEQDFWKDLEPEQVQQAAQKLLDSGHFDRAEVAAYLIFLDMQNQSDKLAAMNLEQYLPPRAA